MANITANRQQLVVLSARLEADLNAARQASWVAIVNNDEAACKDAREKAKQIEYRCIRVSDMIDMIGY